MSKIMVVDDDPDIVYILRTLLQREGHEVTEAYNGTECLRKMKKAKSDLVILDVMMPDIDGWEVCRKLKEDAEMSSIPITMLSIKQNAEDIKKSFESGAAEHLTKPINFREVTETVRMLLKRADRSKEEVDTAGGGRNIFTPASLARQNVFLG